MEPSSAYKKGFRGVGDISHSGLEETGGMK